VIGLFRQGVQAMPAVGKWVAGIVAGLIITVLGALILDRIQGTDKAGSGSGGGPFPSATRPSKSRPAASNEEPAAIYLNRDSGPAGTPVSVSGKGFQPDEAITLRFHTETVGHTTADGQGKFEGVRVQVPEDWQFTGQFPFIATGESSIKSAERDFRVT
jgi:hypothetical protein